MPVIDELQDIGILDPPDPNDTIEETLDEIREAIKTDAGCKRFRDLLYDMGLFGSARARRVKAVAAALGIPIEDIVECLRKSREELEDEEEADLKLELDTPADPLPEDDPDCPIDLKTWLCLPEEELPEEDDICEPPPLPGAEDTRTFDPFPTVPDPDQAEDLCEYLQARIAEASIDPTSTDPAQLTRWTHLINSLAGRSHINPADINLDCLQTTTQQLKNLIAQALPGPEGDALTAVLQWLLDLNATRLTTIRQELTANLGQIDQVLARAQDTGITAGGVSRATRILQEVIAIADTNNMTDLAAQARAFIDQMTTQVFSPPPFKFADPFNPHYRTPLPRTPRGPGRRHIPSTRLPPSLDIE